MSETQPTTPATQSLEYTGTPFSNGDQVDLHTSQLAPRTEVPFSSVEINARTPELSKEQLLHREVAQASLLTLGLRRTGQLELQQDR